MEPNEMDTAKQDGKTVSEKSKNTGKYYNYGLFILLGLFILQSLLLKYPFNEPYVWGFKHVCLPIGIALFILMMKYPMTMPDSSLFAKIFMAVMMIPMYLLLLMPVFGLINAYAVDPVPDRTAYVIEEKYDSGGKKHVLIFVLKDEERERKFKWQVDKETYDKFKVADSYDPGLSRGCLGLLFKFKNK